MISSTTTKGKMMDIQEMAESITESIEGSDRSSNEEFGAAIREMIANGATQEEIGAVAIAVEELVTYVNTWRSENGLPLV